MQTIFFLQFIPEQICKYTIGTNSVGQRELYDKSENNLHADECSHHSYFTSRFVNIRDQRIKEIQMDISNNFLAGAHQRRKNTSTCT